MRKFLSFLIREGHRVEVPATNSLAFLRQLAQRHAADFMRFRCTTARDFLAQMRVCARRVKSAALMTCNNSLNTPEAFYSQCRGYAYNIHEMSQAEDLVVVEDMSTQPRMLADGRTIEYGPAYALVAAISHGKPLVALTIAEGDYHTPPNLVRLAMVRVRLLVPGRLVLELPARARRDDPARARRDLRLGLADRGNVGLELLDRVGLAFLDVGFELLDRVGLELLDFGLALLDDVRLPLLDVGLALLDVGLALLDDVRLELLDDAVARARGPYAASESVERRLHTVSPGRQ